MHLLQAPPSHQHEPMATSIPEMSVIDLTKLFLNVFLAHEGDLARPWVTEELRRTKNHHEDR